jgi:hypothetical protein
LFDGGARLVTLLGQPGVGKSALARRFVADRSDEIRLLDGVESIARELSSLVREWLEREPEIKILITSRCPLGADEEVCFELEPIASEPLRIATDGRWLRGANGTHVDLSRRKALRRILARLARARELHPGRAVSAEELVNEGWPNEALTSQSGMDRLYVAISTLRNMGLRGALIARGEGYLLDPEIAFLQSR